MIKAIIFDFGDVILFNDSSDDILEQHAAKKGLDPDSIKNILTEYFHGAVKGDYDSFEDFFNKAKPATSLTAFDIEQAFAEWSLGRRVDRQIIDYIRKLKGGYKIALLSNFGAGIEKYLIEHEINDLFDVMISSYNVKARKPDREAYDFVLNALNLKPEEVVFVDDKKRNTDAAEALGIKSVIYSNFDQFRKELEGLLEFHNS